MHTSLMKVGERERRREREREGERSEGKINTVLEYIILHDPSAPFMPADGGSCTPLLNSTEEN